MAREEIQKTIDGETYTFRALPATQSLRLAIKLIRFLGLPISFTLDAISSGSEEGKKEVSKQLNAKFDSDKEIKFSEIGKALVDRMDKDEEEVIIIIKESLASTLHSGSGMVSSGGTFDVHFAGRISHLVKVSMAALECEYQDFFDLVRANVQEGIQALVRLGQNQPNDTGLSQEKNSP